MKGLERGGLSSIRFFICLFNKHASVHFSANLQAGEGSAHSRTLSGLASHGPSLAPANETSLASEASPTPLNGHP